MEDKLFADAVQGIHRIRVQREDDFTKKLILHGYLAPDEATESRLAELWGGGKFVVGLIAADEQGRQVIRRQNQVSVLGLYKRPAEIYGLQSSAPAPTPTPTAGTSTVLPVGRLSINETLDQLRLQQVLDIVAKGKETPAAAAVPWDKFLDIGLRVAEMFSARRDPDAGVKEELRQLREEMRRPAAGPVTSGVEDMAKAISAILDIKERISDPTGGEAKGNTESGMLGTVVDLIKMGMQHQGGAPVNQPGPSRIPGKVEVPMAVPEQPPASALPMWHQMLLHARPQLVEAARFGFDPGSIADMATAKLPSGMRGVAEEFLRRPDAALVATQVIPELAEFATWNTAFWAEFKSAVLGEEPEGDEKES